MVVPDHPSERVRHRARIAPHRVGPRLREDIRCSDASSATPCAIKKCLRVRTWSNAFADLDTVPPDEDKTAAARNWNHPRPAFDQPTVRIASCLQQQLFLRISNIAEDHKKQHDGDGATPSTRAGSAALGDAGLTLGRMRAAVAGFSTAAFALFEGDWSARC